MKHFMHLLKLSTVSNWLIVSSAFLAAFGARSLRQAKSLSKLGNDAITQQAQDMMTFFRTSGGFSTLPKSIGPLLTVKAVFSPRTGASLTLRTCGRSRISKIISREAAGEFSG
jgi:hypothetical protein